MSVSRLGNGQSSGVLPSSDDKGKEEDFSVATGEGLSEIASLDTLPTELLSIILNYATQEGRDGQRLCNLRKVCTRWRDVIDMTILFSRWENLPREIRHPILRPTVDRLLLVDHVTTEIISSAWGSLEEDSDSVGRHDLVDRVRALGPSAFNRFSSLSKKMTGSPAVLGFDGRSYESIQSELDRSLGLLWRYCQPNSQFNLFPPRDIMVAHRWFSDLAHADARNRITNILLDEKNLRVLPPEIDQFSQLEWIHLNGHQLRSIPPEIGNLVHLRSLCLGKNLLTDLPDEIGNLSQLETLHLYDNRLTRLPDTIGKVTRLKDLCVRSNLLISLPETIGNLTCLERLDLSRNQLTNFPSSLVDYVEKSWKIEPSLESNPLIYLLDETFKVLDSPLYSSRKHDFTKKYRSCSSHECRSPLASLCQEIHRGSEDAVLRDAFERLSDENKQRIERTLQELAGSKPSSSSEVRNDLFGNRADFTKAVIIAMREKFLSFKEKHDQIYSYCHTKKLSKDLDKYEKPRVRLFAGYGQDSAKRNILLLIDAMELETAEAEQAE